MLKLVGATLILSVSTLFGIQLKQRLALHVIQLIRFKEILLMLSGEISYAKTPLNEAFYNISTRGKEPFGSLLKEISKQMELDQDKTLNEIWQDTIEKRRKEFCLSETELQILKALGENFGYLDLKMQLNHILVCIQQVETRIGQAQQELVAKQKMYLYLSVMSGLFLILLLI